MTAKGCVWGAPQSILLSAARSRQHSYLRVGDGENNNSDGDGDSVSNANQMISTQTQHPPHTLQSEYSHNSQTLPSLQWHRIVPPTLSCIENYSLVVN